MRMALSIVDSSHFQTRQTSVSGRVCVSALIAGVEKAQGRQSSGDRVRATDEAALHADGIGRKGEPNSRDASRRSGLGFVRDQSVARIRFVNEIVERLPLQRIEEIGTERGIIHD